MTPDRWRFRGERVSDGVFIYGSLIRWRCGVHGIMSAEDNIEWKVTPSTVSQSTGKADENGVEIFED